MNDIADQETLAFVADTKLLDSIAVSVFVVFLTLASETNPKPI